MKYLAVIQTHEQLPDSHHPDQWPSHCVEIEAESLEAAQAALPEAKQIMPADEYEAWHDKLYANLKAEIEKADAKHAARDNKKRLGLPRYYWAKLTGGLNG